jgi:hypothetical protein
MSVETSNNFTDMRKRTKLLVAMLMTATSAMAQTTDTLQVQTDSVVWNESLREVSVVASSVRTEGDRTTAFITKEMRRGARNTAQMLGNIRGLTWNAVDNSVVL